jgi:acetamidase/formamidase
LIGFEVHCTMAAALPPMKYCGLPQYRSMAHRRTIHQHHLGWDRSLAAAVRIAPGEALEFAVIDASGGQLCPASTIDDVARLDFGKINPVTGPVFIDGAEPGDVLKVTLLSFAPSGWGWTANIPGFGLLADDFKEPALHLWEYDQTTLAPALFGRWGKVPLKPFTGTIGVAPAEPGLHSIVPPRRVGGNMDVRDISLGTELFLPIEVPGALLSVGDTHAAQGDGEVCGTAIESPMRVALQFDLIKQQPLSYPRFRTQGPVTRHLDAKGYDVTTGIGPDLMQGARDAVRSMIDLLTRQQGMSAVDAYLLCSVCGDLRISEIVDQPNWTVAFYFPRVVFE